MFHVTGGAIMENVLHGIGNAIGRMVRAFFLWAVVVGGIATAWFSVTAHRLPRAGEWGLIVALLLAGGGLGILTTLVWELSHLGTISRAIRHAHEPTNSPS